MKLIVAIIRPDCLNGVLERLYHSEVCGLTVSRVLGHGGETEQVETYRGTTVKVVLHEKVRLDILLAQRGVFEQGFAQMREVTVRVPRRRDTLIDLHDMDMFPGDLFGGEGT